MLTNPTFHIGTAGWSLPPESRDAFQSEGTHLQKYAAVFSGVEINSAFYRDHRPDTYEKWAASVPADFRFSIKLLRYFTQEKRLKETGGKLQETIAGISRLGEKWGTLLIQLPPSLAFDAIDTEQFLSDLRELYTGTVVWEPRHPSWIGGRALDQLASFEVSKVRADPDPCFIPARRREKVESVIYYRLHGTPEMYRSLYTPELIAKVAKRARLARQQGKEFWCIFDNTMFGHATQNALQLRARLAEI